MFVGHVFMGWTRPQWAAAYRAKPMQVAATLTGAGQLQAWWYGRFADAPGELQVVETRRGIALLEPNPADFWEWWRGVMRDLSAPRLD